ncbi:MAG: hypothetical protein BAJALOKI3v1_820005 [Promethearchaeota archaeon]|nr:MAG: hypothetical protein BAJALOKI3v1_820005 [Candidatus Lokiarchaeota archaeon]
MNILISEKFNIDYLLELDSNVELRQEVLKQFLKHVPRILAFLIKEKLLSYLEPSDIKDGLSKFNFSLLTELDQGNEFLLFNEKS